MTGQDLYACDSITIIPGVIYDERSITVLKMEGDQLLSMEPCCGTHAKNTNELQDFQITYLRGSRRGLFEIEAVCGNVAKQVREWYSKANKLSLIHAIYFLSRLEIEGMKYWRKSTQLNAFGRLLMAKMLQI